MVADEDFFIRKAVGWYVIWVPVLVLLMSGDAVAIPWAEQIIFRRFLCLDKTSRPLT